MGIRSKQTPHTVYNTERPETVRCDLCMEEYRNDQMREFVLGDILESRYSSEQNNIQITFNTDRYSEGEICDHCMDTLPESLQNAEHHSDHLWAADSLAIIALLLVILSILVVTFLSVV